MSVFKYSKAQVSSLSVFHSPQPVWCQPFLTVIFYYSVSLRTCIEVIAFDTFSILIFIAACLVQRIKDNTNYKEYVLYFFSSSVDSPRICLTLDGVQIQQEITKEMIEVQSIFLYTKSGESFSVDHLEIQKFKWQMHRDDLA